MAFNITFAPHYESGVIASVTTVSAASTFKRGNKSMCLTNLGAETCFVQISKDPQTATTADYPVPANSQVSISVDPEHTNISYVTQSATTSLHFMTGEGF